MTALATRLTRALDKHQAGELQEAEILYRRIIRRDPRHAEALNLLGALCGQTGRPDQALHHLQKAIAARPDHAAAHYNLANVLRDRGQLRQAADHYERAVALAPGHASAWFNLALTCLDLKLSDRADEALAATVAADGNHTRARHQLALRLLDTHRYTEAAEHLRHAIRIEPAHAEYHRQLGRTLCLLGRFDEAVASLQKAADLNPRSSDAWCALGEAMRRRNTPADAADAFQCALERDPALIAAHLGLARALLDLGRRQQALAACRRALEIDPSSAQAHRLAARVLARTHESDQAEQSLLVARRLDPDSAETLAALGDLRREIGRFDDAAQDYRDALTLDADSIDALTGLALVHWKTGNRDEALRLADSTLQRFPDDDLAAFSAVELYLWADRHADAAELAERTAARPAISVNQRSMLLFKLGEARDHLGDYDAAWDAFRHANELKSAHFDREAFARRIDDIIRAFPGGTAAESPIPAVTSPQPIFILGMPRSGTTLVEQILASHPHVTGAGEAELLNRAVRAAAAQAGVSSSFPHCLAELGTEALHDLTAHAARELQELADRRPRVTEKTFTNSLYLGLIERLFPTARIVICERDPLDTCLSCYFHDFTGNHPYACNLADLGFHYRAHQRLLQHWRATTRLPMITIRYEDLVADQQAVTRRLLEHCSLPWNDACLAFHRNPRVVTTASAEQVRRPLYATSVGRHRSYERHLEPLMAALA